MSLFGHSKSNSLFGSGSPEKKVSPPHKFDWGAAALSALGVDPNIFIGRRRQAAAAAAEQQVRAGLKARGYSDSDIDVLMSDPKQAAALMQEVLQPRQFGPGGGSLITPGSNGQQNVTMAPSRHEYQGSVFDVGGGAPGQQATVTPQHEGTQWVTPQPGTQPVPVNSFTGGVRSGGDFAPPGAPSGAPQLPRAVRSKEEFDALPPGTEFIAPDGTRRVKPQGGPAPAGPATFP